MKIKALALMGVAISAFGTAYLVDSISLTNEEVAATTKVISTDRENDLIKPFSAVADQLLVDTTDTVKHFLSGT